ncbi:hypothetical protein PtA15_9A105 [Puccinia triticina]|uniref:Uncharacterized protein n=1 Tax=Puccinia triticina TaxID=208348 RepID=A0ABY7CW18_9BASI|nr:uncharacterized protein PtA15_9A105 [Puccinia triticina]WAQ87980.1 hypothetical protein PtA15_9A105 [Puccinia triticina]
MTYLSVTRKIIASKTITTSTILLPECHEPRTRKRHSFMANPLETLKSKLLSLNGARNPQRRPPDGSLRTGKPVCTRKAAPSGHKPKRAGGIPSMACSLLRVRSGLPLAPDVNSSDSSSSRVLPSNVWPLKTFSFTPPSLLDFPFLLYLSLS